MEHLLNIFILLGLLLGFYSIGYVLNFFTKIAQKEDKPYYIIFSHLLSGLVLSVSSTACFFTGFKTTSILFLVLFGYIGFLNKNKIADTSFYLPKLYILPLFVLIGYLLSVFKGYDSEGNYTQHIFLDYIYYKQVIANLINGQENVSEWANILDKDYDGVAPYHYFELWLTILVSKVSQLPSVISFMVYIPVIFITIILFGIVSLLENNRIIQVQHICIALALLFVGQVYLPFYERFFWSGYQHVFTSAGYIPIGEKLFPFVLFGIASFVAIFQKKYSLFFCYILFLSIASFTATPAVFGALYLLLLFNIYFKFIDTKHIYWLILFPILYALFLFVLKQPINGYLESTSQSGLSTLFQRFTLKSIIVHVLLRPSYFLFPAFIIGVLLLIKEKFIFKIKEINKINKEIIFIFIFFMGVLLSSSFVAIFYSFDANAVQLINLPLHGFSFGLLIFLISKLDRKMYVSLLFVISMIVGNFYYTYQFFSQKLEANPLYSAAYLSAIQNKTDTNLPIAIATFYSFDVPFRFVSFDDLGRETTYLDNVGLIRMTNSTLSKEENIKNFGVNVFYKFIIENNYAFEEDMTEAQIAFFKKYSIKHLLIQKGQEISPKLESLVIESYLDSISGNRFCIIDLAKE